MARNQAMPLIAKVKPSLMGKARALREQGKSWDHVAGFLTLRSGVSVGREAVKAYFEREGWCE